MGDPVVEEDNQSVLPVDETAIKPEGSEKESTQVIFLILLLSL